jgi:hypothetical protein
MSSDANVAQALEPYHYRPIQPYQTRLLQLHGDGGDASTPIISSLHTVDLLDPTFDGVGLRASEYESDGLVTYDALSYAWGTGENSKSITCDGTLLSVTSNLSDALHALRPQGNEERFLWIDALCINQRDDQEKATQVRQMLLIYQKAARVIAWLGKEDEYTEELLTLIATRGKHGSTAFQRLSEAHIARDFENICAGLTSLYTKPWFCRLWVQQEIFAARKLELQWGRFAFLWAWELSSPHTLTEYRNPLRFPLIDQLEPPDAVLEERRSKITVLQELYDHRLECFSHFSGRYRQTDDSGEDLVETLLRTSVLQASNPKDHIYGIIGKSIPVAVARNIAL